MKRVLSGFLLLMILTMSLSCARADPNLTLQDSSMRAGPWAETYAAILRERAAGIQAYQEYVTAVTYSTVCHPVGLQDLTGDGVPELLFVENVHDTEYGFELGRLWIYTSDGSSTHCALSLQPETDDLLYSELFTGEGDLLTFRFTDTESSWILQFRMDQSGRYALRTELISQEDFSGEGPDQYFLNGKEISADVYRQEETWIRSTQGTAVGSLQVDDGQSGFDWTLEEALAVLGSGTVSEIPQPGQGSAAEASTSPSGGLLPELSFFRGEFTPGEKFAVYSAPSSKSFRSAKGKAAITSGSEIFVAGTVDGWILIQYELDSGVTRVGYIDPKKISGSYTSGGTLTLAQKQMQLTETAEMTDDPVRQKSMIGKLKKGTTVTCLAEYMGWIYAEAKVSGKTARGFLPPSSLGLENAGSGTGPNVGELYGLAIEKLATRDGPGTQYKEKGTYSVKGEYIKVLSRAWDSRNGIWWVKCEIPYKGETRVLWTGYKRFDSGTLPLDAIPVEEW